MKNHQKIGDFREENRQKSRKKRFQKPYIFRMRFLINFGEVWGGFWESLGRGLKAPWRLLGHF